MQLVSHLWFSSLRQLFADDEVKMSSSTSVSDWIQVLLWRRSAFLWNLLCHDVIDPSLRLSLFCRPSTIQYIALCFNLLPFVTHGQTSFLSLLCLIIFFCCLIFRFLSALVYWPWAGTVLHAVTLSPGCSQNQACDPIQLHHNHIGACI